MKRALIVSRYPLYGISYSRIGYDVAHLLWNNGYNVSYLAFASGVPPSNHPFYCPFKIFLIHESFKYIDKDDNRVFEQLEQPDLIFIIEDITSGYVARRLKAKFKNTRIFYYTMFDGDHLGNRILIGTKLHRIYDLFFDIDRIIVPTNFSRLQFSKLSIQSSIIPLYFNEYTYKPLNIKHGNPKFVIHSVARNTYRKNLGNLVRAMTVLKDHNIQLRLRTEIYSIDPTSIDFPSLITNLDLGNHVMFENYSPVINYNEDELVISYNTINLGVYPSMREGWGMPCLETMACGYPIIVTENTAMDDWVPKEMPRFRAQSDIVSGGFTSIEKIVSVDEIIERILAVKDMILSGSKLSDRNYVSSLVADYTLANFGKRLMKIINE